MGYQDFLGLSDERLQIKEESTKYQEGMLLHGALVYCGKGKNAIADCRLEYSAFFTFIAVVKKSVLITERFFANTLIPPSIFRNIIMTSGAKSEIRHLHSEILAPRVHLQDFGVSTPAPKYAYTYELLIL